MSPSTHFVAFLAGFGLALVLGDSKVQSTATFEDSSTDAKDLVDKQVGRKSVRQLGESGTLPMESRHRDQLCESLLAEWADADPAGFLRAWEDRAWPDSRWSKGPGKRALMRWAELDPDGLLAYARRAGCELAWSEWIDAVPPLVALRLLHSSDSSTFPRGLSREVVRKGMSVDPEFHRHLHEIPDSELRQELMAIAAESMLESRRIAELAEMVTMGEGHLNDLDSLAEEIGNKLLQNDLSFEELGVLPDGIREMGIRALLHHETPESHGKEIDASECADLIGALVKQGWADDLDEDLLRFRDEFARVIHQTSIQSDDPEWMETTAMKWMNLAADLPESLEHLRFPFLSNGLTFHALSPDVIRGRTGNAELADRAIAFLACQNPAVVDSIASPTIRERTRAWLDWRAAHPVSDDPFAPEPEYPGILPWEDAN